MSQQLDEIADQFLKEMGFADGIDGERKQKALDNILYTLNINVAKRLVEILSEEQLDQFEKLTSGEPDAEKLSAWLNENVPNYDEIVEEEAQKLKEETLALQKEVFEAVGE